MTSDRDLSIYFFGYPRASRRRLKFARHSLNVVLGPDYMANFSPARGAEILLR